MSNTRKAPKVNAFESQYTLGDFTKLYLALAAAANESENSCLGGYAKQILRFIELIQNGHITKAKAIQANTLNILLKIRDRQVLSDDNLAILKQMITDFENNAPRFMDILLNTSKNFVDALKNQIKKINSSDKLPNYIRSGGSNVFLFTESGATQNFLFCEENKRHLLNQIKSLDEQHIKTAATQLRYDAFCKEYINVSLQQIKILSDSDQLNFPRIAAIYEDALKIVEKTNQDKDENKKLKISLLLSYSNVCEMYANDLLSSQVAKSTQVDEIQIEMLINKAIAALNKIDGYGLSISYSLATLNHQLARIKHKQGDLNAAYLAFKTSLDCLYDCISLTESAISKHTIDINNNNNAEKLALYNETMNARKLDALAAYVRLIQVCSIGGNNVNYVFDLCTNACQFAQNQFDNLLSNLKQLESDEPNPNEACQFRITDLKANLSTFIILHLLAFNELLGAYGQLINTFNNNPMSNKFAGQRQIELVFSIDEQLHRFENKLKIAKAENLYSDVELQQQYNYLQTLRLKLVNAKFSHIQFLISGQTTDHTKLMSNLSMATLLLSKIKDADLGDDTDLKQQLSELKNLLNQRRIEAQNQLRTRRTTPVSNANRLPTSLEATLNLIGSTPSPIPASRATQPMFPSNSPTVASGLQALSLVRNPRPNTESQNDESDDKMESQKKP